MEATGHKLLQAHAAPDGKLTPELILPLVEEGRNEHVVLPRLVYISDATENGAVYTLAELEALSACCRANNLLLFLDGARLGAAFGAAENDVTLPDLARLTDAFYIGGTKNGALMGEALVIVNPALQEGFFRIKKQRGAVLAKGWLLGLQFQTPAGGRALLDHRPPRGGHGPGPPVRSGGYGAFPWPPARPPTWCSPWCPTACSPCWTLYAPMRCGPARMSATRSSGWSPPSPPRPPTWRASSPT